jgi:HSP20 family protein
MIMTFTKSHYQPVNLFGHLLDDLLNDKAWNCNPSSFATPATNIYETKEHYQLIFNVPGRMKEDFSITVENGLLTVAYEKKEGGSAENLTTIRKEFSFNSFKRSFTVTDKVNTEAIQATYENGILKLTLPKKAVEKEAVKQIAVQ